MIRHLKKSDLVYRPTSVDGAHTSICRAVNSDFSNTMGAGVERLEKVSFEWTVTYDEILFIKEGSMIIRSFGSEYRCSADDIMWIPNGTTLVYEVPDVCTYFYALFPVDWAKRQGVKEP